MRYNFHEQHARIKANPKYVLPEDINASVEKYLEDIKCTIGKSTLASMREKASYGKLELIHDDLHNCKIIVQVDCGMAEGYIRHELKKEGKWTLIKSISIKNSNLDKTNKEKKAKK